MRITETISIPVKRGCVLTVGNFDGVHIGHQRILATARRIAAERMTEPAVMTFEPHPAAVLHPEKAPGVLTPLGLKEHLLAEYGVGCLVVLRDSVELLNLSPAAFVDEFLMRRVRPAVVVEGMDFNFGSGRSGDIDTLKKFGIEKGFEVVIVEPEMVKLSDADPVRVSSTLIRRLLQAGQVSDAAAALGRSYRLYGQVTAGRGKGKRLGFPTANITPAEQIIPAEGVYAGMVAVADSCEAICRAKANQPAALSIGRSSTYGTDNPLLVEAHIIGGDVGELYGRWLAMDFVERLRNQKKFRTAKDLAEQIAKDCKKVKQIVTRMIK